MSQLPNITIEEAKKMSLGLDSPQYDERGKGKDLSISPNEKESSAHIHNNDSHLSTNAGEGCGGSSPGNHDVRGQSRLRHFFGGGCGGGLMWIMLGIIVLMFILNAILK
jgi:hypothetical protein